MCCISFIVCDLCAVIKGKLLLSGFNLEPSFFLLLINNLQLIVDCRVLL